MSQNNKNCPLYRRGFFKRMRAAFANSNSKIRMRSRIQIQIREFECKNKMGDQKKKIPHVNPIFSGQAVLEIKPHLVLKVTFQCNIMTTKKRPLEGPSVFLFLFSRSLAASGGFCELRITLCAPLSSDSRKIPNEKKQTRFEVFLSTVDQMFQFFLSL